MNKTFLWSFASLANLEVAVAACEQVRTNIEGPPALGGFKLTSDSSNALYWDGGIGLNCQWLQGICRGVAFALKDESVVSKQTQAEKFRVVNGTCYNARTHNDVIQILEQSRLNKIRIEIVYGDPGTGQIWESATPNRGVVGRSTGSQPIPILIKTKRSMGGEAILDANIIEIRKAGSKKALCKL